MVDLIIGRVTDGKVGVTPFLAVH